MRGGREVRPWGAVETASTPVRLAISSLCGLAWPQSAPSFSFHFCTWGLWPRESLKAPSPTPPHPTQDTVSSGEGEANRNCRDNCSWLDLTLHFLKSIPNIGGIFISRGSLLITLIPVHYHISPSHSTVGYLVIRLNFKKWNLDREFRNFLKSHN